MPKKATNPQNLKKGPKRPPGRPKGSPNKIPGQIKDYVVAVFHKLQDDPTTSLDECAKNNPQWFYEKFGIVLIPKAVEGKIEMGVSENLMGLIAQRMNAKKNE